MSEVTATIDLVALQHNFSQIKLRVNKAKIIAMIKSNGYGHGLIHVAHCLTEADAFGIARLKEALHLREAGITQDLILMPGFLAIDQLLAISEHQIQVVIHHQEQIELLTKANLPNPLNIWLKIDTGMGRLGFSLSQAKPAYQLLQKNKNVATIRFMTHFATVDEVKHPTNELQFSRLAKAKEMFSGEWSAAKSAAIFAFPETKCDWVRPGMVLYGASPFADKSAQDLNLKPVMDLTAPLISVRTLETGEPVGYGSTFICPKRMRVGVVGIGYGDGYPRHAVQGTPVLINNTLVPRIGRVCMDMLMVDLEQLPNAKLGDTVTLWGEGLPVETIAKNAETIPYELLCSVTRRVKFEYLPTANRNAHCSYREPEFMSVLK